MLINGRAKGHKNSRLLIKIYIKKKRLYFMEVPSQDTRAPDYIYKSQSAKINNNNINKSFY